MRIVVGLLLLIIAFMQLNSSSAEDISETIDDIRSKNSELMKLSLPEKESLLLHELGHLETEIVTYTNLKNSANRFKDAKQNFDRILADRVSKQSAVIKEMSCEGDTNKVREAIDIYINYLTELFVSIGNAGLANKINSRSILIQLPSSDIAACKAAQSKLTSNDYSEALKQISDTFQTELTNRTNLSAECVKYLETLIKRKSSIQEKLNSSQTAFQIGSNLSLLLAVLATACVCTILGIKLFDPELQMEWVASGQVIQFVTVMILLSVIFALGLSNILKENTLGTLLGGIAGYVLAQGVGRAAARNVERSRSSLNPVPPPPAPDPNAPPAPAPNVPPAPAPNVPPAPDPNAPPAPAPKRSTRAGPERSTRAGPECSTRAGFAVTRYLGYYEREIAAEADREISVVEYAGNAARGSTNVFARASEPTKLSGPQRAHDKRPAAMLRDGV